MKLSQRLEELAQGKVSAYAHAAELVDRLITAAEIAEQKH